MTAHPTPHTAQQTSTCPVCASSESEIYVAGVDEALTVDAIGQSRVHQRPGTVLRCKRCGLGYRQSRPGKEMLAELYEQQDVETYLAEVPGRRWTSRHHWDLVKSLMPRGNLLDVGCASGLFLERAGDAGWRATGVEPSPSLCGYAKQKLARGTTIVCGTLEKANLEPESFDVVTLWDVLEHAVDPCAFLRACAEPLKPGGFLLLNVPHLESRMARLMGSRWPLLLPEHLCYFTRDSLVICGEAAGLEWIRFDHRPAFFSLGHVFHRLSEHGIPFAATLESLASTLGTHDWVVPVPLGEIVAIYRKPAH